MTPPLPSSDVPNLHEVVHRGKDEGWVDQAVSRRRQQISRRRRLTAAVVLIAVVVIFILSDGPRRTGILDAVGYTCGEFVHPLSAEELQETDFGAWTPGHTQEAESTIAASPFQPWQEHQQALYTHLEDPEAQVSVEEFAQGLHELEEEGFHPELGAFRAWTPGQREFVASAVGEQLVVGHTPSSWSVLQSVVLIDPASGQPQTLGTDEPAAFRLEDPLRGEWEEPRRLMMGLGVWEHQLGLQTHTVSGDTDLVVIDLAEGTVACERLDGAEDETSSMPAYQQVLGRTADLSPMLDDQDRVLVPHGSQREREYGQSRSDVALSAVEISTGSLDSELLAQQHTPEETNALVQQLLQAEPAHLTSNGTQEVSPSFTSQNLVPLGGDRWFLDWEYGYLVFTR